jgi:hypothetical protein
LKSITIPDTVTSIESGAFQDCINLASVNLPSGLTEIQSTTFYNCKALASISIPETVQLVNNGAFSGCSNLSTVTIPASVAKMGAGAFKNCTNLADARFKGDAPGVGKDLFTNASTGFKIYYPSGKKGWTSPTWYGYPTQMYDSWSDLPIVKLRTAVTFPIPSAVIQPAPLIRIDPVKLIPTTVMPTEDEDPDLLPAETPTVPELSTPNDSTAGTTTGTTEIRLHLGNTSYSVNGESKSMDVSPVLINNRLLLPVRYIALPLGATTEWDQVNQKVTVTYGTTVIELWIGNNTAKINGVEKMIDPGNPNVKPVIVPPGRTMLPLRFLGESLGCTVEWNQTLQEATLTRAK